MIENGKKLNIRDMIESDYVIILDANVLLNIYEYSPDFADFAMECLNTVENAIRLPSTVVMEFENANQRSRGKRNKLIENSEKRRLDKLCELKQKLISDIGELERLNYPDVADLKKQFEEGFDSLERAMTDYFSEHEVLNLIKEAWDDALPADLVERINDEGHVLPELTVRQLYQLSAEGQFRFSKEVPPGYKDKKKGGLSQYNDLIIWKEVLNYAKAERKGVVFVTDDTKGDWWTHNGEKIEFHEKLVEEFAHETTREVENRIEHLSIVAFTPNAFYSAVSNSYNIPKSDMVELALEITDEGYVDSIKDDVFSEIEDDLVFSDDLYLDYYEHPLGSEGVLSWDIESSALTNYGLVERDGKWITYRFLYQVEMIGVSHDYWGRDDDTKEPILSLGYEHEVEGEVEILVRREVRDFADLESDSSFESATLFSASFAEVGFTNHDYDSEPDYDFM